MEEKRILLDIILLLVLLFFTSFLSAAESALSSLKQIHLKSDSKEKEKTKESELLKLWLENPNELLTTLLFVKTISYSSMVFTGVYLIKRIYAENLFVGISFFVLIVLILIFSEMVPRLIARNNIYGVSRTLIIPLNTIRIVLKPLIRLFIHISRFIVGIFKIKVKDQMFEITEDEILTFLKAGTESGVFEEGEEEMITSIFEFSETTVKEILTPRRDVFALEAESKIDDVWDEILDQGFTRIPIYTETIDKIVGTVHMKDLLRYDKQTGENPPIKDFMKEAYFVPITKSLIELLEEFKLKQLHMAIVIDEYGGTQGIVTIEDLLEEIVGEIRDEFDQEEENIQQIREKIFDIKGDTPIEEVNDKLNIEIPLSEEYDTISGYIQDKLGKVADVFDQVKGDKFILKVTDMDNKRVAGILIEDNKILLIQHHKNNKKYWLIPGGGNDWGETTKEALIREYKEETNMDIEVDEFLFFSETISPDKKRHVLNLFYKIHRNNKNDSIIKLGEEAVLTDLKFITKEELETMIIYPNIKENLLKLMNNEKIRTDLGSLWND